MIILLLCIYNHGEIFSVAVKKSEPKRKRQRRNTTSHSDPLPVPPAGPPSLPMLPSPSPAVPLQQEEDECVHCFLTPCVTVRELYWLGEGQPAHIDNHSVRKIKYKSYWKTINNLGGWLDPRYIQRKIVAGGQANDKRELMLNCVVNQLRQLYPNPPDRPYMEHMWI